jgi:hypothetical protein
METNMNTNETELKMVEIDAQELSQVEGGEDSIFYAAGVLIGSALRNAYDFYTGNATWV